MDPTQFLAFAAQTKGAAGVRQQLQGMYRSVFLFTGCGPSLVLLQAEHPQETPDVLQTLSTPVLLDDGDVDDRESSADFGIRMEQLSLRVQREIWSALASGASPSEDAVVKLARAFLQVATRPRRRETDAVCLALARMVLSRVECEEEHELTGGDKTTDAAFRRRMWRLSLNRVTFPSQEEDDELIVMGPSRNVQVVPSKRPRAERRPISMGKMTKAEDQRAKAVETLKSQERPPLTKEMEDRASTMAKQLAQLSRGDATVEVDDVATRAFGLLAEVVNDVHTTYTANERSFQYLCQMLRMDSSSDEALLQIANALVDSNWSSRYAAIFLETSVLPKIRTAESVISRVLLQTALRFGSSYTSALVDSLLLPLLVGGNPDQSFGRAQAEAITRILRSPDTVPTDQLDNFIQKSFSEVFTTEESTSRRHLLSNESTLLVFQNILNTKPVLSPLTVEKFVGAFEAVLERPEGEQLRGSLKFATVVFTLISKYPQQCAGHIASLKAIATQLTSIMAKTTLRSLQKLTTNK